MTDEDFPFDLAEVPPSEPADFPSCKPIDKLPFRQARLRARRCLLDFAADATGLGPAGLLAVARIVADGLAESEAGRLPASRLAPRPGCDEAFDRDGLADRLYDDLFDMLRGGGWLDCPES